MTPPRKEEAPTPVNVPYDVPDLKRHELSKLFPDMAPEEYEALKEDIRENELLQPVVLHQGRVLDGWHRYRCCRELKLPFQMVSFSGGDPLAYVLSSNLHRRQLSESQRGVVAAKLAKLRPGANQHSKEDAPIGASSKAEAARILNVGAGTVDRARVVLKHGAPELVEAVESGAVKVGAAAEVAKLPVEEQRAVVAQGPQAVREKAAKMRGATPKAGEGAAGPVAEYAPQEEPPQSSVQPNPLPLSPPMSKGVEADRCAEIRDEKLWILQRSWRASSQATRDDFLKWLEDDPQPTPENFGGVGYQHLNEGLHISELAQAVFEQLSVDDAQCDWACQSLYNYADRKLRTFIKKKTPSPPSATGKK